MNELQLQALKYIENKTKSQGVVTDNIQQDYNNNNNNIDDNNNKKKNNIYINVHFHPDRLFNDKNILEVILEDGKYHSQFVTKTSNGGLSAYEGGDRFNWESRMFGGIYDNCEAEERVKYGSLNFRSRLIGGSPRFGSCYFRLKYHTLCNSTFVYPDSFYNPTDFAVHANVHTLIDICTSRASAGDCLDDYIEAQVHGDIVLERDIEALVMDPCFKDTVYEEYARRLPCAVEWHSGFVLDKDTLTKHPEYRGQRIVDLGVELMRLNSSDTLTPKDIGVAIKNQAYDPQDLKKVYHYIARYGHSWDQTFA
ncbi:hypothetical protein CYY_007649 [Polysphondylium violaceum]|uniref:DUF3626 domain-containing protein n=1 Tax=Polysphondylium violaceum TaxID=133409 RepID=A0A8J4PP09_9MYCE|nr:hypothetical protein CYY_007649 [Polysphondylium violaceum]